MAKFRIWAKSIDYCYLDVEAENVHQAMEVAEAADGGDFHEDGGDWEFSDNVLELDEDMEVDYKYTEFFDNQGVMK